jgi:hypothetical protein
MKVNVAKPNYSKALTGQYNNTKDNISGEIGFGNFLLSITCKMSP